jgi:hypothetical protein
MPTSFSHRRAVALIAYLVAATYALLFANYAWAEPKLKAPDPRETRRVQAYLDSKDCPGAVRAIKDGVKARQPDVLLMAGTMMEEGICMQADWKKAVDLYDMAYQAGSASAWYAMVAALAVEGRDNGSALWYAAQRPTGLPSYCFPKADPLKDLDGFNAELERMTPSVFKSCVYMVGVMHEVFSRTRFPRDALYHDVQANLIMKFVPSSGTISWTFKQTAGAVEGDRSMAQAQFGDQRKFEKSLLNYVTSKSNYALARYTRPEGIDPSLELSGEFVFSIKD